MRRLFAVLLCCLFALPLLLAGALFFAIEDTPLVNRAAGLRPEHIERAKQLLEANDPRKLTPGALRTISVSEEDLDVAVNYLCNRWARGSSWVKLYSGSAHVIVSAEVPETPFGHFLNIDAVLAETTSLPRFTQLRIGQLAIPVWLANWLLMRALTELEQSEDYGFAANTIKNVRIADGRLGATYQWTSDLTRRALARGIPPEDEERLRVYQERLAETVRHAGVEGALSLARLMQPLFQLADQRSAAGGEARAENRAAILILTLYVNGRRPKELVPRAEHWARPPARVVTLNGRDDFPKHFIISAAVAAYAGEPLSDAIGLYKEIDDSRRGSGFSFNDIAADRAGSRFGELAAASASARKLQKQMKDSTAERAIMPATDDLPEFMSEAEFIRRFGGVGGSAYQQMMDKIERRVAGLAFNRW